LKGDVGLGAVVLLPTRSILPLPEPMSSAAALGVTR
jgi:hypothetical protein